MPSVPIHIPALIGGVSRLPVSHRSPLSVASADNVTMRTLHGLEKRPGTRLILAADNIDAGGWLNVTGPTNPKFVHWIDRDNDEKFVVLIDPNNADLAKVEIFTIVDRSPAEEPGDKMTVTQTATGGNDPTDYISVGMGPFPNPERRFRSITVADTTLILNRDRQFDLTGTAIDYRDAATNLIRDRTNDNNVGSWNDLPHPPTGTAAAGVTTSDFIFHTRDDDLGWPSGWYRASSTTLPPWYTRIRTEPANSLIDFTVAPIRLDFDGSDFDLSFPDWAPRFSGDSTTNPGPQLAQGPSAPHRIRDLAFFQNRLFLAGYEFIDSSQSGDVFNMWIDSSVTLTDADPINVSLQSDTVTVVDFIVPFDGGIVVFTQGSRQFELRSQGALTPATVSILPTTSYAAVGYVAPAKLGNQLYFMAEQNNAMIVYEYQFHDQAASNVATNITAEVEDYIPARMRVFRTASQSDMLLALTDGDPKALYVNQSRWDGNQKIQNAWFRWSFDCDRILDMWAYDSTLVILLRRNNVLWLETLDLDNPGNDDDGTTPTNPGNGFTGTGNMGFVLRMDSKRSVQGVYNAVSNETTWTLPFEDDTYDTVVLGQSFDADYEEGGEFFSQRAKGTVLGGVTVVASGGNTVLTAPGKWDTNLNGDNAPCWVGRSFEKRVRLNEQMVRDPQSGTAVPGFVQLLKGFLRLAHTGYIRVEITPKGRSTLTKEFIRPLVGQAILDEGFNPDETVSFGYEVLASSHDSIIELVNDTPYPSQVVEAGFRARFIPERTGPGR
jgi:hypothetical protein